MRKYIIGVLLLFGVAVLVLWSGWTLPTEYALTILGLAVGMDFLTTWLCLRAHGKETNPAVGFLFKKLGVGKTFGVMLGFWVVFVMVRLIHQTEGIQLAVGVTYWLIPINNLIVLRRLRKEAT